MMKGEDILQEIIHMANDSPCQIIVDRNALLKNLFSFIHNQTSFPGEILLLCTKHGLILDSSLQNTNCTLIGHTVNIKKLREHSQELIFSESTEGYIIIALNQPETSLLLINLQNSIDKLLEIISNNDQHKDYLLKCLDATRNAISIFDKDAHLLFANEAFCKFFHIDGKMSVIGLHIHDIMKQYGIKAQSMESKINHLCMMDVLKTGKEKLDCGVRLESVFDPKYIQLVDNDMYPVLNSQGAVNGMIEISRSHQQVLKRTRKIMGLTAEYNFEDIIGSSDTLTEKIKLAKEFSVTSGNVLIIGESGVGKELFAQSIHNHSTRSKGPFVALNCASFPAELIESELFGYAEGAFTGASKKGHIGKIELADEGTLFLDEIGELPYSFQSKLLRILETWIVTRVGSTKEIPVDVRLVAATNKNLAEMAASGLFRQDLYYRLQVLEIEIPPLRKRPNDVLLLAEHFLQQSAEQNGKAVKTLDKEAKKILKSYDWPGNARELRNFINRVDLLLKDQQITARDLYTYLNSKEYSLNSTANEDPETRINTRKLEINKSYANLLREALSITNDNKKEAADLLGVSRKTFYRMLEKYSF